MNDNKMYFDAITIIAAEANRNSKEKGFWDEYFNTMTVILSSSISDPIKNEVISHIKNLWSAKNLMEASGELGEALEAGRIDREANWEAYLHRLKVNKVNFDKDSFEAYIKDSKGDEIADCIIRLLQFSYGEGIPIADHIQQKMSYNAQRPYKHGKKF